MRVRVNFTPCCIFNWSFVNDLETNQVLSRGAEHIELHPLQKTTIYPVCVSHGEGPFRDVITIYEVPGSAVDVVVLFSGTIMIFVRKIYEPLEINLYQNTTNTPKSINDGYYRYVACGVEVL